MLGNCLSHTSLFAETMYNNIESSFTKKGQKDGAGFEPLGRRLDLTGQQSIILNQDV